MSSECAEPLRVPELPPARWGGRALSGFGSALDAALLRAAQLAVDAILLPAPEHLDELRQGALRMGQAPLADRPRRLFAFPEDPPRARELRTTFLRSARGGGVVRRELSFEYRGYFDEAARQETLVFEHWMHGPRRPAGTVVAIHGFAMGQPRIDALALLASQWFGFGLDVALPTLPHHGERRPQGARFSGEAFAAPDATRLAEAVRQAVFELRLLQGWLRQETAAPVGLLGLSLGGYLAALMAGLYDDLDFAVPLAPPVCLGDLAWRFHSHSRRFERPALSRDELRAAFRAHSPLAHPLRVPRERLLIAAGRGDRIVPPEHPGSLWRHWGEPEIHWWNGGHLGPIGRRQVALRVRGLLERLAIL